MSSPSNDQDDNTRLDKDALNHVSVLNDEDLIGGMPTRIFWTGVAATIVFIYLIPWYLGVMFAVVFFTTMFTIHKDDPKALEAWIKVVFSARFDRWSGGSHKARKIYFIDNKE